MPRPLVLPLLVWLSASYAPAPVRQDTVRVELSYRAPGEGPAPNFSPKGTQVALADVTPDAALPAGAMRPARSGVLKVGPGESSWVPVLATASAAHPADLTQLYVDRNRNGRFDDDGAPLTSTPAQNEKTKAWWTSLDGIEVTVPYAPGVIEPYRVDVWIVRDDGDPAPAILRYSVRSWRAGTAVIGGVPALVAAMDSDNDAMWRRGDNWSVIAASAPGAPRAVLSIAEARPTTRFMFLPAGQKELVLEFRSFTPDGRALELAIVDRPMTKAADRAPDDLVAEERPRPRAGVPFTFGHDLTAALAQARSANRRVFIDFETTWCGPCKTMDEWIWTDADVAALLNAGFIGVKLDGDVEKALVKRYAVAGYPTMLIVDSAGKEVKRAVGYQSSKAMAAFLK